MQIHQLQNTTEDLLLQGSIHLPVLNILLQARKEPVEVKSPGYYKERNGIQSEARKELIQ